MNLIDSSNLITKIVFWLIIFILQFIFFQILSRSLLITVRFQQLLKEPYSVTRNLNFDKFFAHFLIVSSFPKMFL
jgi:hypothetical protein